MALVIGNDSYQHLGKLEKAGNDASAMARELKAAGFDVELQLDANYRKMSKTIDAFVSRISGGDQVVVFYAGHGVQIKSGNYLLPTDLEKGTENEIERFSYSLDDLTARLSEARASFSLVIIDACRNNPIAVAKRSVGASRGLSPVEPPKGQMVVFSASRGQEALDKLSEKDNNPNGVFTREFLARMKKPGVKIQDLMVDVQDAVEGLAKSINHDQRPALYNESRGNFYFYGNGSAKVTVAPPTDNDPEIALWNEVKSSSNKEYFSAYLQEYPKGKYAALARLQINKREDKNTISETNLMTEFRQGQLFKDCSDCPDMAVIPAGIFMMGSTSEEQSKAKTMPGAIKEWVDGENPKHSVKLKLFAIGKTEVSRLQYSIFASATGHQSDYSCQVYDGAEWKEISAGTVQYPNNSLSNNEPVECVNWDDAQAYVKWLSQKTGKHYRLPSEAEWEYACRGGSNQAYCGSDNADAVAVNGSNGGKKPRQSMSKQSNAFGLYDMSGNVWEWTQDCWNENYTNPPTDGSSWLKGNCNKRVFRGGSWSLKAFYVRSALRMGMEQFLRHGSIGFRIARDMN